MIHLCPLCRQHQLAFSLSIGNTCASCTCGFQFVPPKSEMQLGVTADEVYNEIMAVVAGKANINETDSRVPVSCYECGEADDMYKCKFGWTHRSSECLEHFGEK